MKTNLSLLVILLLLACSIPAKAQIITTIAGNGTPGYMGDGGPATAAEICNPSELAIDKHGNIYMPSGCNNGIRKIDSMGIITTIAGTGISGYSGDGGPATAAELSSVDGIVLDSAGNIYVADASNSRIRKIDAAGMITTIAGNGIAGNTGDGGPATDAEINANFGMVIDGAGNLYFLNPAFWTVRKVDVSGVITAFAGNGIPGFSGDGGPATAAQFGIIQGLAIDETGNVYIDDFGNNRIRKVNTSGIISTFAGGIYGYSGDGGPVTAAAFEGITGVAVDRKGNVYISDLNNYVVHKVDASGIITTIAGNGTADFSGDGGPATAAQLSISVGCLAISGSILYISDLFNHRIRALDHAPYFINGQVQNIAVCADSAAHLDSLLAVADADSGQTQRWSLLSGPSHGAAAVVYSHAANGDTLIPSGLSYMPMAGYTGSDTIMVRVWDGMVTDTTAIYVNVTDCHLGVPVAATNGGLDIYPSPNDGTFTFYLSSNATEEAHIIITNAAGEQVKEFTARTNKSVPVTMKLPAGAYFVSATTARGKWSKQFLITR